MMIRKIAKYLFADKQLLKENFTLVGLMFAAFVVNYLYHFSMGRLLGPEGFGVIAVLFAIIYLLLAPMNTIQAAISKFVAEYKAKENYGQISYLLRKLTVQIFLYSLLLFAVFVIFSRQISSFLNIERIYVVVFSFYFLAGFVVFGFRGVLQGLQRFKEQGVNFLYESLFKLVFGLLLVFLGYGVSGAIGAMFVSVVIAVLFGFFSLRDMLRIKPEKSSGALGIKKYAFPMLIAMSAVTALYTADVIIVKHFYSAYDAGLYSALALMGKIIFFGVMPITQVMFPKIAERVAKNEPHKDLLYRSIGFTLSAAGFGVLFYFLAPKLLIAIFFGEEYLSIALYMGWFGGIMLVFSLCYLLINYFLAIGKTRFGYGLLFFAAAEFIGVWLYHESFQQVLLTISFIMVSMLAILLLYYGKISKTVVSHTSL